jgi:carboxypeptidase C (cathepsin A)
MTEMGPFRPQADLSLELNEWRWNKLANMVYVEQPVGVGFSYAEDSSDYRIGDKQAGEDAYNLVKGWLNRFSSYQSNDLYWSAESYGGHYTPVFSATILEKGDLPNYRGFLVGNPFAMRTSEYDAMWKTYWGHQLISKPTWDAFNENCRGDGLSKDNLQKCELLATKMTLEVGNLNPYALDYPVCLVNGQPQYSAQVRTHMEILGEQYPWLRFPTPTNTVAPGEVAETSEYDPCTENYATTYLNQESVKEAIHVKTDIDWEDCSTTTRYNMLDRLVPMKPLYRQLVHNDDLRVLVYSGDDDAVCGTVGTQSWVYDLGKKAESLWQVWEVDGQVAGYLTRFEGANYAFATIRNAGHECPAYRPKESYELFSHFLNGDWFEAQD